MNVITLTLIAGAICSFVLSGCASCEPVAPLYIQGSVVAQVNTNGLLVKVRDQSTRQTVAFTKPGQSRCVVANEPFVLSIPDAIDMARYSIQIQDCDTNAVRAGSSFFRITLVESCMPVLLLTSKCKILNWYNPYRIPEIRVSNSNLSQLVMTPLLSDDDEIIGYEVRLGDHRDCGSPALRALEIIRKAGVKPKVVRPNTIKTPRSIELLCQGRRAIG